MSTFQKAAFLFENRIPRNSGKWFFFSCFILIDSCSLWKYIFGHQVHAVLTVPNLTKSIWRQKTVDWLLVCVLKASAAMSSHPGGSHRGRVRPPVLMIDSVLSIFVCSCFRPVVKITDTVSLSLLPSILPCAVRRNWILFLKLSSSGWSFSEAQTACVITDRSIPCGVPSQLTLLAQEMMRSMQLWHWQAPERRQLYLLEKCSPLAQLGGSASSLLC